MALTKQQLQEISQVGDAFLAKRRPPVHIRDQIDLAYRVEGQSVFIYEIRPLWDNSEEIVYEEAAKATWVKRQQVWKVYWMRGDLKWYRYDHVPSVPDIATFFRLVDEDELACFFG